MDDFVFAFAGNGCRNFNTRAIGTLKKAGISRLTAGRGLKICLV
jgi:hypothetical protein